MWVVFNAFYNDTEERANQVMLLLSHMKFTIWFCLNDKLKKRATYISDSGDALGIYPQNNTSEVQTLLKAIGCTGNEACTKPNWAYQTNKCDDGKWNMHNG